MKLRAIIAPSLSAVLLLTTAHAQTVEEYISHCALRMQNGAELDESATVGAECMVERAANQGGDALVAYLNQQGKARFGTGFSLTSRMRYAPFSEDKVAGDVDLVMPLMPFGATENGDITRAVFLQNGATIYRDLHGDRRHDIRLGFAHRAAIGDTGNHIIGASLVMQENREYGHRRMVSSLDYVGAWGSTSLNLFQPETAWRPARAGYEERALAGRELAAQINLTDTLDMSAAFGKWEQQDDPDVEKTQGRFGFQWRPHTYLKLSGNRSGIDTNAAATHWRVALEIPLGGAREKPRWQGFGVVGGGGGGGGASAADLWRRVDNIGRIQVAEREVQHRAGHVIDGATVRFLQSSAPSGGDIRVEVVLPAPVEADTPLVVTLEPGDDANPAVPGVDYVDEPVTAIVRAGETSAIATIRLLTNHGMTGARSLGVTVHAG